MLEGVGWWNQAFTAAGYKDAFQVKLLPEGVDPMDVRYNVVEWVPRSTRGWSIGNAVTDPRTGEIINGHVRLDALRIRQVFLSRRGFSIRSAKIPPRWPVPMPWLWRAYVSSRRMRQGTLLDSCITMPPAS